MATNVTCSSGDTIFTSGQLHTDASNVTYTVSCATNNFQGAYEHVQVENAGFSACFAACDSSADCVGWTFSGTDYGFCYLKNGEGISFPADDSIVSGFKVRQPGSLTTSSSVAAPTPSSPSCSDISANGTTFTEVATGDVYQMSCGYDYNGYDISFFPSPGYDGCFDDCSLTANCTAIAYLGGPNGGFCYTKYNIDGGGKSLADSAKLISKNGQPFPVPTTAASTSTSSAPVPTFTGWMVQMNMDHPNGDLEAVRGDNFTACQTICDDTTGCIGYAYVGSFDGSTGPGLCYLKSSLTPGFSNELVNFAYKAVATPPPPTYTVEYATDHVDGDITSAQAASFTACEPICNKLATCIAYAYVGPLDGPGTCYLKSSINAAQTNNAVNFAYKATATKPTSLPSASSSTPTAEPEPTVPFVPGSCEAASAGDHSFTTTAGTVYMVECGTDHRNGDIGSQSAGSFIECIDVCDRTAKCLGYAYVGGTGGGVCYLKSFLEAGEASSVVDFAYKNGSLEDSGAASTSSAAGVSTAAPQPVAADGSCAALAAVDNGTYADASGQVYEVTCGSDVEGGVVGISNGDTFESCMSSCDITAGCDGFAYVTGFPGTCYLKGGLGDYIPNRGDVGVAVKVVKGEGAAEGEMSSTTASSTDSSIAAPTTSDVRSTQTVVVLSTLSASARPTEFVLASSNSEATETIIVVESSTPTASGTVSTSSASHEKRQWNPFGHPWEQAAGNDVAAVGNPHFQTIVATQAANAPYLPATSCNEDDLEHCTSTIVSTSTQYYGPFHGSQSPYPAWVTAAMPLVPTSTEVVTVTGAGDYTQSYQQGDYQQQKRDEQTVSSSSYVETIWITQSYTQILYTIVPTSTTVVTPTTSHTKVARSAAQKVIATQSTSKVGAALPSFASTASYTRSQAAPVSSETVAIINSGPAGDDRYCYTLAGQPPLLLRTKVLKGPKGFANLYIRRATTYESGVRHNKAINLTPTPGLAASIFLLPDGRSSVLSAWDRLDYPTKPCSFTGLAFMQQNSTIPDSHGEVAYFGSVGTKGMVQKGKAFVWEDERFGGWLVCKTGTVNSLKWWDLESKREVDWRKCALVELVPARMAS